MKRPLDELWKRGVQRFWKAASWRSLLRLWLSG
jgi:hypothetical protein